MEPNALFDKLIDIFEADVDYDPTELFVSDGMLRCSALGFAQGPYEIADLLKSKRPDADVCKIRVFNNVCRRNGNTCLQSAYLVMLFTKMENGFMHVFQCGFLTSVKYVKHEKWLIKSIKRRMTFECGNSMMTGGKWNLIDYSVLNGCADAIIDPVLDSPWYLEDADGNKNAEEKAKETFFRYNWLIDNCEFDDLSLVYTDPYLIQNVTQAGISGSQTISTRQSGEIFKDKRYKTDTRYGKTFPHEACWNHISHFEKISVNGDEADALIYRYEPNRIGTRFISKCNYRSVYYSGEWKIKMVRNDKDEWKICAFSFSSKIIEDINESDGRYF